jgi:hypothetical protein
VSAVAAVHSSPRRVGKAGGVGADRGGPSTASILLGLVAVLCVVGVVMVGSASEVISIEQYHSPWAILIRELMWMTVGGIGLFFALRFDYHKLRQLRMPTLIGTFFLLLLVLVPGIGVAANGSSRWIGFGQFRLQPSELMKFAIVIFAADLIVRRQETGGSYRTVIGPILLVAGLACGLILMQPDMGTALVIAVIAIALLFASGVSMRPTGVPLAPLDAASRMSSAEGVPGSAVRPVVPSTSTGPRADPCRAAGAILEATPGPCPGKVAKNASTLWVACPFSRGDRVRVDVVRVGVVRVGVVRVGVVRVTFRLGFAVVPGIGNVPCAPPPSVASGPCGSARCASDRSVAEWESAGWWEAA